MTQTPVLDTQRSAAKAIEMAAPGVRALTPYAPGKPIAELEREYGVSDIIKLASNENPLGPSPLALEAARAALADIALYPDGAGFELKAALARKHEIGMNCITLGNGSNDVLDLVARAFLTSGSEAVYDEHAFAVYPIATQAVGATGRVTKAHDGSRGPRYGHDLEAMRAAVNARTRVVFIANPNNPTGTWLPATQLEAFIRDLPEQVVVVVDEAYVEYVDEADYSDASRWLSRYPNLIVTRTFSKAYALAGLRAGYALSHPDVADLLNRVRQPFNLNSVAQAAARAALDDTAHLAAAIQVNRDGMRQLTAACEKLGLDYIPSVGNFICIDVGRPGGAVYEGLLRAGVIVRPVANYGLPNHLRVTIGTIEQNARFIAALTRVLGK
jgi:histidinol-phosphate aminotransferase